MSTPINPERQFYMLEQPREGARLDKKGKDRDREAARLKALGMSLEQIAVKLNLGGDPMRAAAAIRRALADMVRFANDEMRFLEVNSLDELEHTAWSTLQNNHIVISNGRIVRDDDDTPITDDRFVLELVDRILKIKERRAKLLGLDAPTRAEVLTIDSIEGEIAKLERELRSGQ